MGGMGFAAGPVKMMMRWMKRVAKEGRRSFEEVQLTRLGGALRWWGWPRMGHGFLASMLG